MRITEKHEVFLRVRALNITAGITILAILLSAGIADAATQINSCTVISSPGDYMLNQNIINSSQTYCINITSGNVVLEGAGHTIDGKDASGTNGVYVHNPAIMLTNVTIRNLIITDWAFGIYLDNVRDGSINGNNISSNDAGISLASSGNNTIYNNYFSNTNNFLFGGTIDSNYWNITKTIGTNIINGNYLGGNFWANPSGKGFSETCTDADFDGICDSYYTLASGNLDYLPLTNISAVPPPPDVTPPADTTAPVITILGANPVDVVQNSVYTDAGATAVDVVDGPVTVNAVSTVDTAVIGTYTVTYTATDLAGNTATAVRTVNIVALADTTAPVITILGANPVDVVQNSVYTDTGATAVDAVDGPVTVNAVSTVDTAVIGTYTVTYTATDLAGNTATAVRIVNVVASPIRVASPGEYSYDIIGKTGQSGITWYIGNPSINDNGVVAFTGGLADGEGIFTDNEPGDVIEVIYEEPIFPNPFGHSAIRIGNKVYDVSKEGEGTGKTNIRERNWNDVLYDNRGQQTAEVPLTYAQKLQLKKNLESAIGSEFDYSFVTNNCADWVEDRLREVGVNIPDNLIQFPKDTLHQVQALPRIIPGDPIHINPSWRYRWYGLNLQINNSNKIIATDGRMGSTVVRIWDANIIDSESTVVRGGGSLDTYEIVARPSINNKGQTVFVGLKLSPEQVFLVTPLNKLELAYSYPIPMIDDTGHIVVKAFDPSLQRECICLYDYDLGSPVEIASASNGFTTIGMRPGISDDGKIVVFAGDRGNGYGIFASIDEGGGTRKLEKIAGEKNEPDFKPELGKDSSGNPLYFSEFDLDNRLGVAHQDLGAFGIDGDSFVVTFIAKPNAASPGEFSDKKGIWTIHMEVSRSSSGALEPKINSPKKVVQIDDDIGGRTIIGFGLNDPIANAAMDQKGNLRTQFPGEHRIAFMASTNAGDMVVRASNTLEISVDKGLTKYEGKFKDIVFRRGETPVFFRVNGPLPVGTKMKVDILRKGTLITTLDIAWNAVAGAYTASWDWKSSAWNRIPDDIPIGEYEAKAKIISNTGAVFANSEKKKFYAIFQVPNLFPDELSAYLYDDTDLTRRSEKGVYYYGGPPGPYEWQETEYPLFPFDDNLFEKVINATDGETKEMNASKKLWKMVEKFILYEENPNSKKNVREMFKAYDPDQAYRAANELEEYSTVTGQCLDYANGLAGVLRSIGIPGRPVTGTWVRWSTIPGIEAPPEDQWNYHVWTEVYFDDPTTGAGDWYVLDSTDFTKLPHTVAMDKASGPEGAGRREDWRYGPWSMEVVHGNETWNPDGGKLRYVIVPGPTPIAKVDRVNAGADDAKFAKCELKLYDNTNCNYDPPLENSTVNITLDKSIYRVGDTIFANITINNTFFTNTSLNVNFTIEKIIFGTETRFHTWTTLFYSFDNVTIPASGDIILQKNYTINSTNYPDEIYRAVAFVLNNSDNRSIEVIFDVITSYDVNITIPPVMPDNSILITMDISNKAAFVIENTTINLEIPEYYRTSDPLIRQMNTLSSNESKILTWWVMPMEIRFAPTRSFFFDITSSNGGNQNLDIYHRITRPATLSIDNHLITIEPLIPGVSKTIPLNFNVSNIGDLNARNLNVNLLLPESVTAIETKWNISSLASGEDITLSTSITFTRPEDFVIEVFASDDADSKASGIIYVHVKASDTVPPASITNLQNISFAQNYISWTWIDPLDLDFKYVEVWIDGVFIENVSKGVQFYNATGLLPDMEHTISTRTVDITGNINPEWVEDTSRTALLSIKNKDPASDSTFPKDTTSAFLSLQTDKLAECRLSDATKDFSDMTPFDFTNSLFHSITVTNLTNGRNYKYFINCKDQFGNQNNTESFTFYIHNRTFLPPVVEPIPAITTIENETMAITINAVDPENDPLIVNISDIKMFGYVPIASRFIVDDQKLKLNTTFDDAGIYYLRVEVNDGYDTVTRDFILIVINVNRPPVLEPIGNQTLLEGKFFSLRVNAHDPDGDEVIFSDDTTLFNINPFNGLISFTPKSSHVGVHYVKISATDGEFTDYEVVPFRVVNINNPPTIEPILPQQAIVGELFTLQINASDPDGDALTFSDDTGLFNISTQGLINFTPAVTDQGNYFINIAVTDGLANSTRILNLVIMTGTNRPPIIINITDQLNVPVNQDFDINVTACDPDTDAGCG